MATFYNNATLSYNGTVTTSNTTVGELLEALSATKTAVVDTYTANDSVTYVVSITNTSAAPITGVTVRDNLGAYTYQMQSLVPLTYVPTSIKYYVNGALQAAPTVTAGPPMAITGITIPARGNVILVYETETNQFAPLDSTNTITNTVTIQAASLSSDVTATETITVSDEALLTISKSLSPTTVTENGRLTYTFVIQNTGNAPATIADNVTLTDTFNPILRDITVTFNGTAWVPTTNYTYNETTGLFTTVPGQITVPAATYTRNPVTGAWEVTPGISTLTITGTV